MTDGLCSRENFWLMEQHTLVQWKFPAFRDWWFLFFDWLMLRRRDCWKKAELTFWLWNTRCTVVQSCDWMSYSPPKDGPWSNKKNKSLFFFNLRETEFYSQLILLNFSPFCKMSSCQDANKCWNSGLERKKETLWTNKCYPTRLSSQGGRLELVSLPGKTERHVLNTQWQKQEGNLLPLHGHVHHMYEHMFFRCGPNQYNYNIIRGVKWTP